MDSCVQNPKEMSVTIKKSFFLVKVKNGKGVPLHAMEAHGGRGGIAPTHT
jgi:hypothetical protein